MPPTPTCLGLVALATALALLLLWSACPDYLVRRDRYASNLPFGATAELQPKSAYLFRVLQISDPQVEWVLDRCKDVPPRERCGVRNTSRFIERLVRTFRPDFVVVSGDLVFGPRTPLAAFDAVLRPLGDVPYATILGNHDVQRCAAWDQRQVAAHLTRRALLAGTSSLRVTLGAQTICLYMIDYSYVHTATWVNPRHLEWAKTACGNGTAAAAFTHFPIAKLRPGRGTKYEPVDSPPAPASLVNALQSLPAMTAVGFGHDHVNDFCDTATFKFAACYAGSVGYTTYGRVGFARRARLYDFLADGAVHTFKVVDGPKLRAVDPQRLR